MCLALWANVNKPICSVPRWAKRFIVRSRSLCATPRSQKSGRIVRGPKKPTLPQSVAKLEPISLPPMLGRMPRSDLCGIASEQSRGLEKTASGRASQETSRTPDGRSASPRASRSFARHGPRFVPLWKLSSAWIWSSSSSLFQSRQSSQGLSISELGAVDWLFISLFISGSPTIAVALGFATFPRRS